MTSVKRVVVAGFAALALVAFGAPTAASAQAVYDVNEVTEKPRIASPMAAQQAIQRAYSRTLQARGIQGRVILQFVVGTDGEVDPASVVVKESDESALTEAARNAIEGIQFVPGAIDGSAVATRVVFPITFVAG